MMSEGMKAIEKHEYKNSLEEELRSKIKEFDSSIGDCDLKINEKKEKILKRKGELDGIGNKNWKQQIEVLAEFLNLFNELPPIKNEKNKLKEEKDSWINEQYSSQRNKSYKLYHRFRGISNLGFPHYVDYDELEVLQDRKEIKLLSIDDQINLIAEKKINNEIYTEKLRETITSIMTMNKEKIDNISKRYTDSKSIQSDCKNFYTILEKNKSKLNSIKEDEYIDALKEVKAAFESTVREVFEKNKASLDQQDIDILNLINDKTNIDLILANSPVDEKETINKIMDFSKMGLISLEVTKNIE